MRYNWFIRLYKFKEYNLLIWCIYMLLFCCCCLVIESCLTFCDPMDCSLTGLSVSGILQARILQWVAIPFSRVSSQPRDQTQVSHTAGRFLAIWATGEAPVFIYCNIIIIITSVLVNTSITSHNDHFKECFFSPTVQGKASGRNLVIPTLVMCSYLSFNHIAVPGASKRIS